MSRSSTYATFVFHLLGLPRPALHQLSRLGLFRKEIDGYLYLMESAPLADFPPSARKLRARGMIRGFVGGRHVPSHEAGFYPYLVPDWQWPRYPDLELRAGRAFPETVYPVIARGGSALPVPVPPVALHIHSFYLDGLDDVRRALETNVVRPHLYITTPAHQVAQVEALFDGYGAPVSVRSCRNIGRDVLPFLELLPELISQDFALIGHIHLKKSLDGAAARFAKQWTRYMVSSLVGDPAAQVCGVDDILRDWCAKPQTALYLPHNLTQIGWGHNRPLSEDLRAQLNTKGWDLPPLPERPFYSVGTMFWAQPSYLKIFAEIDAPWDALCREPIPGDGTILHAIERLFGVVAQIRGERVAICPPVETRMVFSASIMAKMQSALDQAAGEK